MGRGVHTVENGEQKLLAVLLLNGGQLFHNGLLQVRNLLVCDEDLQDRLVLRRQVLHLVLRDVAHNGEAVVLHEVNEGLLVDRAGVHLLEVLASPGAVHANGAGASVEADTLKHCRGLHVEERELASAKRKEK